LNASSAADVDDRVACAQVEQLRDVRRRSLRLQSSNRLTGRNRLALIRHQRRNRNWARGSWWVATKVPLPCRRTSRFSAASSSTALRTVPWLTWKRAASSISLGISSPGFHSPCSQALHQQVLDLLVQRQKRRRAVRPARRRRRGHRSWFGFQHSHV
jgi:hypothetical protein